MLRTLPFFVALALSAAAWAKPKAAEVKNPAVALFPIVAKGKVSNTLLQAVNNELLAQVGRAITGVLGGEALEGRVRGSPLTAIARCNADAACVARLGKNLGAQEVMFGVATPGKGNLVRVEVAVVNVAAARLDRKVRFELTRAADAKMVVRKEITGLAPAAPPGGDDLEMPALADISNPNLVPLAPLVTAPPTPAEPPTAVAAAPEPAPKSPPPEPPIVASPPPAPPPQSAAPPKLAFAPPASSPRIDVDVQERQGRSLLFYGSVGAGVLGAAALGGGVYKGLEFRRHQAQHDERAPERRQTQQEAQASQKAANSAAALANILYGAGGALALIAGGLFTADVWTNDDVQVSASTSGVTALWRW